MPATVHSVTLLRRVARRARREFAARRRVTVRVSEPPGSADQPGLRLRGEALRLVSPELAGVIRLAMSGRITGQLSRLDLVLEQASEPVLAAIRPPRFGQTLTGFRWRRSGGRLWVSLRWSRPYDAARALSDLLRAILRVRAWDQLSGPVYALDRHAWQTGATTWPHGRLMRAPPAVERDDLGRPLGPYQPAPVFLDDPAPTVGPGLASVDATRAVSDSAPVVREPDPSEPGLGEPVLITAVANPFGRRLVGVPARYRWWHSPDRVVLRDPGGAAVWRAEAGTGPEAGLARTGLAKYAVVEVDTPIPPTQGFPVACLRTLAACGVVFAAADPAVRADLTAAGVVAVPDPEPISELTGYAHSVQAARQAALRFDPALRRTELAELVGLAGLAAYPGDQPRPAPLSLPTISVVLSTMRPEHLATVLGYLAAQTYPALEVVIGLHGYDLTPAQRERVALPVPVRMVSFPKQEPLGAVLGKLSRIADGELITKLDDDDHYGPNHFTDLFLAWHTSGADLVAKGARFVHFPERDETIDRAWAAPELFNVTPAGGTMLLSRGALAEIGGWSHASKHVDADLLTRVRTDGGLVYRTHALEYVYVRRTAGHTFVAELDELLSHAERVYPGLPPELITPGYAPQVSV